MRLIKHGKVKDIYEIDDRTIIFHFSDRVSAFDIMMRDEIPLKGKILADFAEFWFETLKIKNHFIKRIDNNKIEVKKLSMIPIECVVRRYLYGSLYSRYINGNLNDHENEHFFDQPDLLIASKLPFIMFDPTTKSELHDIPITQEEIIRKNVLTQDEYTKLKNYSIDLFKQVEQITNSANFITSDIKFEFGKDPETGDILLADSVGPDEFRLWDMDNYKPGTTQESFDKQILRDWLEEVGFKNLVQKSEQIGEKPIPPRLPDEIINKISDRYIEAYERITNKKFIK